MANKSLTTLKIALPKAISAAFGAECADDLSQGVSAGFGILSYRGKVWRVKYKGVETVVMNAEGDPAASISVVMLKANPALSKTYYEGAYVEGDDTPPACSSANGITPDAGIKEPQSSQCDTCPQNVWGSKITPQGTETKACSDARRIAVVPAADMANEACGGPMLMRVPAASLSTLAGYSDLLKQNNAPYYGVITKVGFDPDASYPKLVFTALRGITETEARVVLDLRDSSVTHRILEESTTTTGPEGSEASRPAKAAKAEAVVEDDIEDDEEEEDDVDAAAIAELEAAQAKVAKAKAAKAKKAAKAAKAKAAKAAKVEEVVDEPIASTATKPADDDDLDIDALVGDLLGGDD